MLKRLCAVMSALLTSAILFAAPAVSAASATKGDYQNANTAQKEYYNSTYVPSYNAYRQALLNLKAQIKSTNFETEAQAQRVLLFLKDLQSRHSDFFGTRDTAGKSRYDVPAARDAMYQAADSKNYDLAVQYCSQLKSLVEARVGFLNQIRGEVESFVLLPTEPTVADASVIFNANAIWSSYSFGFNITVANNTSSPISGWTLKFDLSGATVNTVWLDGSSLSFSQSGNTVTIAPQYGATIPANGTLVISGNANGDGNAASVSNCTINGQAATISYTK